jgi:2,3-bisphosphoglycerate-dependent phosphoglycerate mutase
MDSQNPVIVHYARHGENRANLTRELSHRVVDYPLTERGVEQARELAGRIGSVRQIYSSPLRRAVQTAEVVGAVIGRTVEIVEELRELNVGALDGRRDPAAWQAYHAVLSAWRGGDHDVGFPDGENHHMLVERLRGAFARIAAGTDGPVLVVGHGAGIRAAVSALSPGTLEPGHDLANSATAQFAVTANESATRIRLVTWPPASE